MLKVARQTHLYSLSARDTRRGDPKWGVDRIVCLPDGKTLVTGVQEADVRVWDLTTQRCVRTLLSSEYSGLLFTFILLQGSLSGRTYWDSCIEAMH